MPTRPLNTLDDDEIRTVRRAGRRRFLGLVALGGIASVGAGAGAASAQAADGDSGNQSDPASCPRGAPGTYTGLTDSDDGAITDLGGYGRGGTRC